MRISKIIWRITPHLLGWGALILIILLQNDLSDWDFEDYYVLGGFFGFMGIATYINLYLLIPRYLFRNKYWHYAGFVSLLVIATALLIAFWMTEFDQMDWLSRFIVMIINVVLFLLLTSGGKFLIEYLQKMIKFKEIENKQLKAELSLLKAQVHPHFMFNTLNNLYSLIISNKNEEAAGITLRLSDLMRYLLESSKTDKISLKKEIRFLEDYIDLEKIRLPRDAKASFKVSGFKDDLIVAPMLFIPMVENAFKHGFQSHDKNPFARFTLSIQANEIFFEAINSKGKHQVPRDLYSGLGLENLKKRLSILYPEKHLLEISDTDETYKILLNITLTH